MDNWFQVLSGPHFFQANFRPKIVKLGYSKFLFLGVNHFTSKNENKGRIYPKTIYAVHKNETSVLCWTNWEWTITNKKRFQQHWGNNRGIFPMVKYLHTTQNQPKNSYKPADFRQNLQSTCAIFIFSLFNQFKREWTYN